MEWGGRWMTIDEALREEARYRAKIQDGFVFYQGRWMTIDEKLRTLEVLWEDICHTKDSVPSPRWHGDVLLAREKRLADGSEGFTDWEEAKKRIRDSSK